MRLFEVILLVFLFFSGSFLVFAQDLIQEEDPSTTENEEGKAQVLIESPLDVQASQEIHSSNDEAIPQESNTNNDVIISYEHSTLKRISGKRVFENVTFEISLKDAEERSVEDPSVLSEFKVFRSVNKTISKFVVVKIEDGLYHISFEPSRADKYIAQFAIQGKHINGSPINFEIFGRPTYRRDYKKITKPAFKFALQGSGIGELLDPCSIGANSLGQFVVADTRNHRVSIFDKTGKFVKSFGTEGKGPGQFFYPYGLTVDYRNDQIVVSDTENHRVQIFDAEGNFIQAFGTLGSGNGELNRPDGVTVDARGNYYVCDIENNRVQIFDKEGRFVRKFGSLGIEPGQLYIPLGIGVLSNGNVVVSEHRGNRLSIFTATGKFVKFFAFGQRGAKNVVNNPCHIFVDSDDNILVADRVNKRIQLYASNGTHIDIVAKDLDYPRGITMDRKGRIAVTEYGDFGVSIF